MAAFDFHFLEGYPDYVGKRFNWAGYGSGPSSYTTGGIDLVLPRYNNYIDLVIPSTTVSGTYSVVGIPSVNNGRATWKLKWIVFATGAEVANAVDLSAERLRVGGFGGVY